MPNASASSMVAARPAWCSTRAVACRPRRPPSSVKDRSAFGGSTSGPLATNEPRLADAVTRPSVASSSSARRTVARETPRRPVSSRSDGRRSPGPSVPLAISSAISRYTRRYSGCGDSPSATIGGEYDRYGSCLQVVRCGTVARVAASWRETALWRDLVEVPEALRQTLAAADGFDAAADALRGATRVIATGNGAAYYVAQALWLASLDGPGGPVVEALPGGLVAGGRFGWRDGDRLLAVSSSGEFRDVIDAVERGAPRPVACVTATPESSVGKLADGRAVQTVLHQRALTHTQAFCGGVATALAVWARVTGDAGLTAALTGVATAVEQAIGATERFMDGLGPLPVPSAAVVFGSGPAWAAALEGALFLKEVAMVPTEGCETREGGTTAMFALGEGQLVLSLATRDDPLLAEAERTCASRGATVVRLPGGDLADRRLAPITALPAITAMAASLALTGGLDPDHPSWEAAYYQTARRP